MNQPNVNVEYVSFTTWRLIRTKSKYDYENDDFNRYNKGFLHEGEYHKDIGFFHEIGRNFPLKITYLAKPTYIHDNTTVVMAMGISDDNFKRTTETLLTIILCNN